MKYQPYCLTIGLSGLRLAATITGMLTALGAIHAQTLSFTPINSDASTGLSASNTYTHAVDLAGIGAVINGVAFSAGSQTGNNYILDGASGNFFDNSQVELPADVGSGVNALMDTFFTHGTAIFQSSLSMASHPTLSIALDFSWVDGMEPLKLSPLAMAAALLCSTETVIWTRATAEPH